MKAHSAGAFLQRMQRASHERLAALEAHSSRDALEARAGNRPPPTALTLSEAGFDLLAEVKFASPSAGPLASDVGADQAAERARAYAAAGAAAISVLTEPTRFAGSLEHLSTAAEAVSVPVLRKDFLVDPLQVLEARAAGASGVLLIARMLDDTTLAAMLDQAEQSGLFVLLEAFDEEDLERSGRFAQERASASNPSRLLVGVNSRDLVSLTVEPGRLLSLAPSLPTCVPCVAESGIETPADARAVAAAGYRMALVGSALMRASDPYAHLAGLLLAGRQARAEARP